MTDPRPGGWSDVTVFAARPVAASPRPDRGPAVPYDHELRETHRHDGAVFLAPPDPSPGAALDVLVETLCDLLEVDYAGVHVLDRDVHRVLASSDTRPSGRLPRTDTLCGVLLARHVPVGHAAPLQIVEVRDTATDPTLPVVHHDGSGESAQVRFYAAAPLLDDDGIALGTLCVIAHHPRSLTAVERRTLLVLGVAASYLLARCRRGQDG